MEKGSNNISSDTRFSENEGETKSFFQRLYPAPLRHGWVKWALLTVVLIAILIPIGYKLASKKSGDTKDKKIVASSSVPEETEVEAIDPDNPPKFIQTDFVELNKVYSISKFRSGMGHDYSYLSGENCRSMKHYFTSLDASQPTYKYEGLSIENFPAPTVEKDVKIFSPVDGTLDFADEAVSYNQELNVTLDAYPRITISFQHVQKAPDIKKGKVKAGDLIGLVLANQSFDLAIQTETTANGEKKIGYISYFAAMPDEIFAKYQARGVKTREDLIISREYRDAHPLSCHGKEVFDKDYPAVDGRAAHIYDLTGYSEMVARIDALYPVKNILKTQDTAPTRVD